MARHFEMPVEDFEKLHIVSRHGEKRILRRKKDKHFGRICRYFDTRSRNCSVYAARPTICRQFPTEKRCGYYDFLKFERRHQDDPDFVAVTNHKG